MTKQFDVFASDVRSFPVEVYAEQCWQSDLADEIPGLSGDTMLETRLGMRPVRQIMPGNEVKTMSGRWRVVVEREVRPANPYLSPVVVLSDHLFGVERPVRVSRNASVLLCDPILELYFDSNAVLAKAADLAACGRALVVDSREPTHHLCLDRPDVIAIGRTGIELCGELMVSDFDPFEDRSCDQIGMGSLPMILSEQETRMVVKLIG